MHIRLKRETSTAIWFGNLENDQGTGQQNSVIYKQVSLRRILGITWSDSMRNQHLCKATKQESAEILPKRRRTWIGHTLRKPTNSITRRVLQWKPQR